MAFAYFDRVKETSTTTGTGVFTLAGAVLGFQAFSAVYVNADTLHYVIFQASTGAWEVGFGTWLTGNQLQRTTVLASSNAGAAVNFAAGSKEVFVQSPATIPSLQGAYFFSVASAVARDAIPVSTLRLGALVRLLDTGAFYSWTGSAWVLFIGFSPTGSAAGQTQIWNGSAWAAGALDLADPDSHTGTLGASSGGTGIAGAGGTANRVLLTTTGTSWAAGLVDLATMVTGTLAVASLGAALATSVFGRSPNSSGNRADIQTTVDGQLLRRAGGVLGFGALDLADVDAVTGLLPGTNVDPAFGTGNISTTGTLSAGKTTLTPAVETSGSPYALRVTGAAHTTLASTLESPDIDINLGRTVQFATGAIASQRAVRISAPTYAFVGASTITSAATFAITGAPVAGTNATLTNAYAMWVQAGAVRLGSLTAGVVQSSAVGLLSSSVGVDGQVMRTVAGAAGWGALDLADVDAVTGLLPFGNFASLAGLSVFGRSANTTGVMAAITGVDGQVLRVSGTTLGFGTIAAVGIADGTLPVTKLANATAASVLGRSANSIGPYADIASSADGQTLRRAAGVLGWGALDLADVDAVTGLLPFGNLASLTGLSVLARSVNTTGVAAAIVGTADQVLRVNTAGTALAFGTIATGGYTDSSVTLAKIANGAAVSLLGNATGSSAAYADIVSTADGQTLRRAGGVLGFGALDLADVDAVTGLLPFGSLTSLVGLSVFGRSANTAGVMAAITGIDGQVLRVSGTALNFGTVVTAGIADANVTMVKLANLAGLSLVGRSANTTGVPAAITASATGQVLRYSGTTIAFGALDLADPDALTSQLPLGNLTPSGTNGRVLVTSGGAAAWGFSLGNTTDDFVFNGASLELQANGVRQVVAGTSQFVFYQAAVNWDNGVVSPSITQQADTGAGSTADMLLFRAQAATGTGATVGGVVSVRGGDSTNGTGGVAEMRSGDGNTADGAVQIYTGPNLRMNLAGSGDFNFQDNALITTGPVILGASPAASGLIRVPHNKQVLVGLSSVGGLDRNLVRWGNVTSDTVSFGDSTAASELYGTSITMVSSGAILKLDANGVLNLTNALTAPSSNPASGCNLWCEGGALWYRGGSGTVQRLAPP